MPTLVAKCSSRQLSPVRASPSCFYNGCPCSRNTAIFNQGFRPAVAGNLHEKSLRVVESALWPTEPFWKIIKLNCTPSSANLSKMVTGYMPKFNLLGLNNQPKPLVKMTQPAQNPQLASQLVRKTPQHFLYVHSLQRDQLWHTNHPITNLAHLEIFSAIRNFQKDIT